MSPRYEIRDSANEGARGQRFKRLEHAQRELAHAVPAGRFYIFDRETKERVDVEPKPHGYWGR